ncbi:MAG TPA: EscU/YscU/HrcU family type III secretion system export apparatus switch protein [Candidatus Rubrimentiphilum sp.]|nr:EscU/YscU/HrcU family type III secretion system export apparatus switch protein [Candidatus Rubrimentiphilum sp.]
MAEEKHFEATHSRLEKAKREGDVARSQDLCALFAFAGSAAAVAAVVPSLAGAFRSCLVSAARGEHWLGAARLVMTLVLVPVAAGGLASLGCATLQGGLALNLRPKFERLSPAENGKRILSRETLLSALRSLAAFACAAFATIPALREVAAGALRGASMADLSRAAWHGSLCAVSAACACAGAFAIGDYFTQSKRRRSRLRMSHDEMRRDRKEQDGDPLARNRRRSLHRMLARGSLRRVKDAAFIVCNPEHIAVALEYRPPAVPVPRVLVRAADETAARVRAIAAERGIPLVRNVALARILYETHVEQYIPPECYVAVAEIVAQLRGAGLP